MIAFVFPGQGSQKRNMIHDFYSEQIVQASFQEASDALGFDLLTLIQENEEKLNQTEFTQPAILAASLALYRLWVEKKGILPTHVAGHSLGEYTALVVAKVLSFHDALRLVHLRGQLMQNAVPSGEGAMAAILGLDDQGVMDACQEAAQGDIVSAVNFNAPGQVVIAGHVQAVTRAIETAKALGAKRALPLPVSVPSHCILMKSAAEKLGDYLENVTFSPATLPVIQNIDAGCHTDSTAIKEALIQQLYHPVQWVKSMQKLESAGVSQFVECGPGKVLTGLNKRIIAEGHFYYLEDQAGFAQAQEELA